MLAGHLNVATNTIGQWERGERRPTGAALKLLHLVKRFGVAVLGEVAVATGRPRKRRTVATSAVPAPASRDGLERTAA